MCLPSHGRNIDLLACLLSLYQVLGKTPGNVAPGWLSGGLTVSAAAGIWPSAGRLPDWTAASSDDLMVLSGGLPAREANRVCWHCSEQINATSSQCRRTRAIPLEYHQEVLRRWGWVVESPKQNHMQWTPYASAAQAQPGSERTQQTTRTRLEVATTREQSCSV